MKRSLPILCASLLLLQGCYDDLTDIQQFMNTVKASTPATSLVAGKSPGAANTASGR